MNPVDDLGTPYAGPTPARRVVSLVPSLTEALVSVDREAVVGATDWCAHPADLVVKRIRGTKNPDLAAIRDLAPDVVIANKEENREIDVTRLRSSGVAVWVTDIRTVDAALSSMGRLFDALGWSRPTWLIETAKAWADPPPKPTRRVAMPIWRDPWMVIGSDNFTTDLLLRLGWQNVFADHADRYPHVEIAELKASGADVVLLPDEPYVFNATDGPEAFDQTPTELVDGRLLTWYGPSLAELRTRGDLRREI